MEFVAKYTHTSEISEILRLADYAEMEQIQESGGNEGSFKPPVTERRYIRENVATGGTRAGRDNAMSQTLMGGGDGAGGGGAPGGELGSMAGGA